MAGVQTITIPCPTGGLNLKDMYPLMPAQDAFELTNMIPESDGIRARNGSTKFVDVSGGTGASATVAVCRTTSGTEYLISINDTKAIGVASDGSTSDITNSLTLTERQWQTTNFMGRMTLVNGTDPPKRWAPITHSTSWTEPAWSGPSSASDLINVSPYRRRLYFLEKNSSLIWYGGLEDDNAGSALLSYDCGGYFTLGGRVMLIGSNTGQEGLRTDETLIVVSDQGEVLCFQGSHPGSSTWNLVGRWIISPPFGYRSHFHVGGDYHIITKTGIVPMGHLINGIREGGKYRTISEKIDPGIIETTYWSTSSRASATYYPRGRYVILCIPATSTYFFYVMNVDTGAWAKWTGWDVNQFVVFNQKLYGAYQKTTYNTIIECDDSSTAVDIDPDDDSTSGFTITLKQAYNYFGSPKEVKHVKLVTPIAYNGAVGTGKAMQGVIHLDPDYRKTTIPSASSYYTFPEGYNTKSYSVPNDPGACYSIQYEGKYSAGSGFRYIANMIQFEKGGFL